MQKGKALYLLKVQMRIFGLDERREFSDSKNKVNLGRINQTPSGAREIA